MNWTETRELLIAAGIAAGLPTQWLPAIDLSGAYLRGANLSGAKGPFTTFSAGRHTAVFAGGYGVIGCERWSYESWLTDYDEIGRNHDYGDDEIADYGVWIKLAVARQQRIEAGNK